MAKSQKPAPVAQETAPVTVDVEAANEIALALGAGQDAIPASVEGTQDATPAIETPLDKMEVTIVVTHAKETNQTIISRATSTERWFAKNKIRSFKRLGNGQFEITLTRGELKYRDMLPEA